MTTYFPYWWKYLMAYKLLILRTYHQFSGRVWPHYDQAFCQHVVAVELVRLVSNEWSSIQFSCQWGFFAWQTEQLSQWIPEPSWVPASQIICRSWNKGRCSAQSSFCHCTHCCSPCVSSHCFRDCFWWAETQDKDERRHKSLSSPPTHCSRSKARR